MRILKTAQKIPGGLMLGPMAIAALIHTFWPKAMELGNPFSAVFSSNGTMCIVGIMLVFSGIQTRPGNLIKSFRRSGVLILVKLMLNTALCMGAHFLFGKSGVAGISLLAFTAALTSCNPGVYLVLMDSCGDDVDAAGFALLNLVALPFIPLCILSFTEGRGINWQSVLATLLPFLLGMALALLDNQIRDFTKAGTSVLLPFLGFCLGSSMDLRLAFAACGSGLLLFLVVLLLNLVPLLAVDRWILRQPGHCAAAICCVAGLALTVPALAAQTDAGYLPYVDTAVAQIGFAVTLSVVVTPVLVYMLAGGIKLRRRS